MSAYWVREGDEEDYEAWLDQLIDPFSDAHDDDISIEGILVKIAELYGPLDHLIFDDFDGEPAQVLFEFDTKTRTFKLVDSAAGGR